MSNKDLMDNLTYTFNDENEKWLNRALTRPALESNPDLNQSKLSTLGDGLLRAILVERHFSNSKDKGELTKNKIKDEKNKTLSELAEALTIFPFIKTTDDEKNNPQKRDKMLRDTLEAIIGAIYFDGKYDAVKITVNKWYDKNQKYLKA